ncbi:MAG: hypothetical protein LBB45_04410 [Methanobrevibacter sp.]|nr:hypothetical protein [Candidatus Methanovirga basalitermitum]
MTNQRNILTKYGLYGEKILSKYIEEVEENDCTNREGLAAGAYFTSMFGKGFNRRDEENEINKVLNYLYSILLSIFSRCIVEYGYITHLGI